MPPPRLQPVTRSLLLSFQVLFVVHREKCRDLLHTRIDAIERNTIPCGALRGIGVIHNMTGRPACKIRVKTCHSWENPTPAGSS
jgi:hypothetical protein